MSHFIVSDIVMMRRVVRLGGILEMDMKKEDLPSHYCHTLISSGDNPLLGCDPRLTTSRYLAPIVRQFVKF